MHPPIRALSAAVIAAGIAVAAVATPASATPPTPPTGTSSAAAAAGPGHTVTLITGDVVTLHSSSSGNTATVLAADGTPSNSRIVESNGDLYVFPQSAMHYVAAGTLDKRLFNVSQLVADGYDDATSAQLPLIVTYADSAASRRADAVPAGSARVRAFSSIDGASLAEARATSAQFWAGLTSGASSAARGSIPRFASGIEKIWLDGKVHATLADSTAQIGAQEVWADGNTGAGVTVAVIDTGIDSAHPDFVGKIADSASFVPDETVTDRNGHGTHVASTIAGTGAASGGKERGVAPGAMLDVAKVLSDAGSGQDSWVLAGMEWAARDKGAKIISMSLGAGPTDGSDPLSQAVDSLTAETGALFVVAAGNAGSPNTVAAPGAATAALTVGAVDSTDSLAYFSSQGPRLGDRAIKPEITAPGVDILAARSQFAPEGEGYYQSLNGTSMATPHVAGAAALLLAAHPELDAAQLKDDLVSTSTATPAFTPFQAGTGRADAAAAVKATVFASGTASVDRADVSAKGTVTQPIRYTNIGAKPVTLTLALSAPKAPSGLFALSAKSVTVPAHGTADVTLTTTVSASSSTTDVSGEVVASSGSTTVARTSIAVGAVIHKLTLTLKDENGAPGNGTVEFLQAGPDGLGYVDVNGSTDLYLPEGSYSAMIFGSVTGVHGPGSLGSALIGNPDITLTKDREVVLDFSKVRRLNTTVPQETRDSFARLDYFRKIGDNLTRSFDGAPVTFDSMWTVPTSSTVTHGEFDLTARWRKEQPELTLTTPGHAYTDVIRQLNETPLPKGTSDLGLVFAGTGTAAEFAAVRAKGKAVVVRHSPDVAGADQASAAIAAGAKILVVADDGRGIVQRSYSRDYSPTPIEVVGLSHSEGERLITEAQKMGSTATITATPEAAYVYDVAQSFHNQIPQSLTKHEDRGTLARIAEDFSSAGDAPQGEGEFRYDFPVFNDWAIGYTDTRPIAAKRTDWVSVSDAYLWGQEAFVTGDTVELAPRTQYARGSQNAIGWYKPITRPYLNNAYRAPTRTDNGMYIDVPGFGGGDHVGMAQSSFQGQTTSLYQGDRLVASNGGSFVFVDALPSEKLPYRFVTKTTQGAEMGGLSTSTTTQWNFSSGTPAAANTATVLPFTQLGYGITANAKGAVKNESTVTITPQQLAGAVGTGTLGKPTVALSYDDGKTWRSAVVSRGAQGAWTVTVEALLKTKYVSIRTDLADSKGNSVSQTIIRAFGVK